MPSAPTTSGDRLGAQLELPRGHIALGIESEHEHALLLEGGQGAIEVGDLGDPDTACGTRGDLPYARGHRHAAPLGQNHPVRTEGVRRAEDRAEVAGIGDAVEGNQQRRLEAIRGDAQQLIDLGVLVRRDGQRHTLMHGMVGHAVEVRAAGLRDRQAARGGQSHDLAHPLVGVEPDHDRQLGGGAHVLTQRFEHGVAPAT